MSVEIIPRESEEQWLAERMTRITATDIGRLANGGPSVFAAVKAEKHGVRSFFGNRYTEWGHEREPLIVSHLEFEYDLVANDALYVNGGRAATPDAVANGLLGEVKTTVTDWWQGDDASTLLELRRVKPQHLDQSLWAQDVAEVDRTVFAWEPHENFIPGQIRKVLIDHDPKRLAELAEVEERFLEYLAAEDKAGEWDGWLAKYAEIERRVKEATAELDAMKDELREKQGDAELAVKSPFGLISYATPKPRATFDTTAFKKAHADLAEEFTKLVPAKAPTLRVTVK